MNYPYKEGETTLSFLSWFYEAFMTKLCVGLFGTCGGSKWRDPFMAKYEKMGVEYFNPQVEDWDPSLAEIEAEHLAKDQIILFPITSETYASGSLSEIGFSVMSAMKLDDRRDIVVLIDQELDDTLMADAIPAKESLRARALVKQHLLAQNLPNVYLVDSLEDMLNVSLALYEAAKHTDALQKFSVKNLNKNR